MAIRRSAATETQELIAALTSADTVERETAAARLGAIGPRVVPHLLLGFGTSASTVTRARILKILASTGDRRGLTLALDVLAAASREPAVTSAAIDVLAAFLDGETTQAVEALGAIVVDQGRPDGERLAAWQMLQRMPARSLVLLRKRLATDTSAALRRLVTLSTPAPAPDAGVLATSDTLESAARGEETDPAVLAEAAARAGGAVPLTTLHRLVELARERERQQAAEIDRRGWLAARGAVHAALARRGSRVAVYDLRDSLAGIGEPLPAEFLDAVALVGDAACVEAIAERLARVPGRIDRQEARWRDQLLEAGRAIVQRERLTRRHAAVRRISRKYPDVARVLLA